MPNLVTKPEKCGACLICELVCTYHHTRAFGRQTASIEVIKDGATGDVKMTIHESEDRGHRACDQCENETHPLCAQWCPVGAIVSKRG